ncbi:MAG: MFS transporter [SAR202 cluster bacterium]|nr:MFS transporter [SAR202 cluster bacterium]
MGGMSPLRSFGYRDFRFLWGGTLVWAAAIWMQRVAISWLVLELTDSPFMVALSFSLPQIPYVLIGPFVGAVADRVNRKYMLIGAQVVMCAGTGGLAALVYTESGTVWLVIGIAVVLGVAMSVNFLSMQALVFDIVEPQDRMNGLSLWFVGMRAISAVGALLGGEIIERTGIWPAFMASSIVYALSGITFTLMRYRSKLRTGPVASVMENLKAGLRHMLGSRELASLLLLAAVAEAFGWGIPSLLAIFASDAVYDVGPRGLGILSAAFAFGGMVGSAALAFARDFKRRGLGLTVALAVTSVTLAGFSQAPWFVLAVVLLAALGVVLAAYDTFSTLLVQANVPEGMRGRAFGALQIASGVGPVGPLMMGFMAGFMGVQTAVGAGAAVVLAVAVLVAAPRVRRME